MTNYNLGTVFGLLAIVLHAFRVDDNLALWIMLFALYQRSGPERKLFG
jgi:hypothetical protein